MAQTKEQSLGKILSTLTGVTYGKDTEELHLQRTASALEKATKDSGKSIIEMLSSSNIEYATNEEIDALFDEGGGGGSSSSSGSSGSSSSGGGMTAEKFEEIATSFEETHNIITLDPQPDMGSASGYCYYGESLSPDDGFANGSFALGESVFGYSLFYGETFVGIVLFDDESLSNPVLYATDGGGNWDENPPIPLTITRDYFMQKDGNCFDNIYVFANYGLGNYNEIRLGADNEFSFIEP